MEGSVLTEVLLPAILAFIMFGMGLTLTPPDFTRLVYAPKPVLLGLLGQLIMLPIMAFMLAINFNAPTFIAIGMMVLAACPGGTTSNLFSHIARANLALSVSLTAITTVVCVFTTPFLIKFALAYFSTDKALEFSLIKTSLGLVLISLVPITIGMTVRHFFANFALRTESLFRHLAMIFMIVIIIAICIKERDMLVEAFPLVFMYALLLNAAATIMGIIVSKLGKLPRRDETTLGIEIGTQNSTMAMLIAISFIQEPALSIAPAAYGLVMYIGATALVFYNRNCTKAVDAELLSKQK
ncbi:MAG: bile acid:sodium symporter family protein [Pseudomonadota bacterium]